MNELRDVLIFVGFSFRRFFFNFLYYMIYFFVVLFATVFLFFYFVRTLESYYLFAGYMVLLVIVNSQIEKYLFSKRQLALNLILCDFLENKEKKDFVPRAPGSLSRRQLKEIKARLKEKGVGFVPDKLLLAAAALLEKWGESFLSGEKLRTLKQAAWRYLMIEFGIFLIILVPFMLISVLFTAGFGANIRVLICVMGFLFAYFLNAVIIDPIISLLILSAAQPRRSSGQ